jgi:hypothetical protein
VGRDRRGDDDAAGRQGRGSLGREAFGEQMGSAPADLVRVVVEKPASVARMPRKRSARYAPMVLRLFVQNIAVGGSGSASSSAAARSAEARSSWSRLASAVSGSTPASSRAAQ